MDNNKTLPSLFKLSTVALVTIGLLSPVISSNAMAQDVATEDEDIERIITIGTRVNGRTATESPVPVDIISGEAILASGALNTPDMLRKLAPSFNMNNTTTSDGQDLMRPATLRSLGPDQVLVLVNGKRRHQQALVAVQQNVGRGNTGTDLSAIPMTAIKRVEILRDGAAAQYGSDAIAGVINIVLKDDLGGEAWGQFRTTDEGDGDTWQAGANFGFEIGDGGSVNITYEYVDADEMNRATETTWFGSIPEPEQLLLVGEGAVESDSFWLNSELPVGDGELYFFAGYTKKEGASRGFFRGPGDNRVWPEIYPNGITPELGTETTDTSASMGYRWTVGEWDLDVSGTYGINEFEFRNIRSLNASYGPDSPTSAYDGQLEFNQTTFNFDAVRELDLSFAEYGANLAIGAEMRTDGYAIEAGDEVAYARGDTWCGQLSDPGATDPDDPGCEITAPGMQGFQGYRPDMEVDTDRDSWAVYLDMEFGMTENFDIGFALRYEDYDDFGETTTGKVTARYQFSDALALRSSVSTGFRAPGMQQRYFTQRSISIIDGELADLVTLRPNESLAQELGFKDLQEEESTSYTVGLVYTGEMYSSTIDIYQIDIDDRIVYSGPITRGINDEIDDFFERHGINGTGLLDGVAAVEVFTNAIDTETFGVDWVNTWTWDLQGDSSINLEASIHYNDTDVKAINTSSSIVPDEVVFDNSQMLLIEDAQPGERAVISSTYYRDDWSLTGRINYYGEVTTASYGTPENTWDSKATVDLTGYWDVTDNVRISGGILNLTDEYPDEWGDEGAPFNELGFKYGWTTFPFSLAGREYYIRGSYSF